MNNVKVYTPPSAEMIVLFPEENLAAVDWKFNHWGGTWYDGYQPKIETTASTVGIINGGTGYAEPNWETDGFTLKK